MERREFIAMLASTPAVSLSSAAEDQTARPAAAPKPLSITLLGTGTPSPSLERQSSGYLIEIGHDVIVWDHGPGAHHRLLQSGHRVGCPRAPNVLKVGTPVWCRRFTYRIPV